MSRIDEGTATNNTIATLPSGFRQTFAYWVGRPSIAQRLTVTGILVLLASCLIFGIATFQAISWRNDSLELKGALDLQDDVYQLVANIAEYRLAAVDLVNDANTGHDATERQRQLNDATAHIVRHYPLIAKSLDKQIESRHWASTIAELETSRKIVLSVRPTTPIEQREEIESRIEEFNEELAFLASAVHGSAFDRRQAIATRLRNEIRSGYIAIAICCFFALGVGFFLFLSILRSVIPPARMLKDATQRMAAGELDVTLPESHFSELQELGDALESFRGMALRDREMAFIDFASGLPNRRAFLRAVEGRADPATATVALIDIDRFKQVNDDFGHQTGDLLVRALGDRLMSLLPSGSIIARFGGDEFAAYIPLPHSESPHIIAERIVRECRIPFILESASVSASVSVGITSVEGRDVAGADFNAVLHEADLSLYAAKNAGRNVSVVYGPRLAKNHDLLRSLERELGTALDEGQMRMVYQPILAVDGNDREVEALIRWAHPEHGDVSPQMLIDVAERSGQMVRLGDWILERVFDDLGQWPDLTVSINLSAVQLQNDGFAAAILQRCRQRRIVPARVMFEVTETVAIEQNSNAFLNLGLLRGLGFRIALDDFGAGYSSLWLLKSFHFDRLKMDRSLIFDLTASKMSQAVFEAAVKMGRQLGMEVVAEGVFDASLIEPLEAAGVTHLQGFHFSEPLELAEVSSYFQAEQIHWLDDNRVRQARGS